MYKEFFGFNEEPFRLTPDPDFFYCSPIHDEAIEIIEYGINSRKGFIMLTGEVGTGKTTICRVLLNKLIDIETSLVLNPLLSASEILKSIVADFGIKFDYNETGEGELYNLLAEYFTSLYKKNKNALIIVDEAQNLSFEAFEMIRQISNIEMENVKLVQILLVGQTELPNKLSEHRFRQLSQRISLSTELKNLNYQETENYINFRINQALKYNKYIFTKSAIKLLYKKTHGSPREINQVADHALLIASSNNRKKVIPADINKSFKSYKINSKEKTKLKTNIYLVIIILIIILSIGFYIATQTYFKTEAKKPVITHKEKKKESIQGTVNKEQKQNTKAPKQVILPKQYCIHLKTNTRLRFEPLLIDNTMKILPIDSTYKIVDNENGWLKIQDGKNYGWVLNKKENLDIIECNE